MTSDGALFDPGPATPPKKLSRDQRLTLRRRQLLDRGIHPITGARLAGNGETCGSCGHLYRRRHACTYIKCDLNDTHGAQTDVRVGWPACTMWTASTGDDDA